MLRRRTELLRARATKRAATEIDGVSRRAFSDRKPCRGNRESPESARRRICRLHVRIEEPSIEAAVVANRGNRTERGDDRPPKQVLGAGRCGARVLGAGCWVLGAGCSVLGAGVHSRWVLHGLHLWATQRLAARTAAWPLEIGLPIAHRLSQLSSRRCGRARWQLSARLALPRTCKCPRRRRSRQVAVVRAVVARGTHTSREAGSGAGIRPYQQGVQVFRAGNIFIIRRKRSSEASRYSVRSR